jgi:hypothetical protein
MACIRDERKAVRNQGSRPQQVEYAANAVDALSLRLQMQPMTASTRNAGI